MGRTTLGERVVGTGLLLCLALLAPSAGGAESWRLQAALGGAHSFGSTLTVSPAEEASFDVAADWDNRNLESPLYYSLSLGYGPWAVRLIHLKVFLSHPPPPIERFSVSHGYNLVTLERSFPLGGVDLVAGVGLVVVHPEVTLNLPGEGGAPGDPGYRVSGPTGALGLARNVRLGESISLVPEVRFTVSRARMEIGRGDASAPNASIHILLGVELRF